MSLHFSVTIRRLLVASSLVALTACSQKIDGTSMDAFQASFKEMSAKMTTEEARRLDNDLATLMRSKGLNLGQLRQQVDGMSAKEIHAAAKSADLDFKRARLAQVEADLAKLEQADAKARAQKEELAKFVMKVNEIKGDWKFDPAGYDRPENRAVNLSLTLANNTTHTVTGFHYNLNVAIDGREQGRDPWSYTLAKPLAPGETLTVLIDDKGNAEGTMDSSISTRVTEAIIGAIKSNPDVVLSATISLSSINTASGAYLDAEPPLNETRLRELREQQAELTAATLAG